MNEQAFFEKIENHRFKNFGFRGDKPMWILFVEKAVEKKIDNPESAKVLMTDLFFEHTGVDLYKESHEVYQVYLKKESSLVLSRYNHGMSAGMLSFDFWKKAYELMDEL